MILFSGLIQVSGHLAVLVGAVISGGAVLVLGGAGVLQEVVSGDLTLLTGKRLLVDIVDQVRFPIKCWI